MFLIKLKSKINLSLTLKIIKPVFIRIAGMAMAYKTQLQFFTDL